MSEETPKKKKPKIPMESYPLLKDHKIGASSKEYKKGQSISLTEKGAKYFVSLGLIKLKKR